MQPQPTHPPQQTFSPAPPISPLLGTFLVVDFFEFMLDSVLGIHLYMLALISLKLLVVDIGTIMEIHNGTNPFHLKPCCPLSHFPRLHSLIYFFNPLSLSCAVSNTSSFLHT